MSDLNPKMLFLLASSADQVVGGDPTDPRECVG